MPGAVKSQGPRNAHSMVFHQGDERIYLFGGATEKAVKNDLWFFDEGKWQPRDTEAGPSARTFAAMVYDEGNNRIVLFGGSRALFGTAPDPDNLLGDTWQFQNGYWRQLEPAHSPSPRAEASLAYDPKRQRLVLFGGYFIDADGGYKKLGDTWEYDGEDWRQVSADGPSPRHGVALWYDTTSASTLLFGGSTEDRQYGKKAGETWTWDGEIWQKLEVEQPPGIFNAAIAPTPEGILRFGGWNGKSRTDETWLFTEALWTELETTAAPSPRNHSSMVFDGVRVILYGGHDGRNVFGDTWSWQDGKWQLLIEGPSMPRVKNGH